MAQTTKQVTGASAPVVNPPPPTPVTVPATSTAKTGLLDNLSRMAQGMSTVIPAGSALQVDGQSLTQVQILGELNGFIQAGQAATEAKQASVAAHATWDGEEANARSFYQEVKAALIVFFGKNSPQLAQFGINAPKKAAKLTSQQALARAAKAAATKALRGTLSKKAKAALVYQGSIQVTAQPASGTAVAAPDGGNTAQAAPEATPATTGTKQS